MPHAANPSARIETGYRRASNNADVRLRRADLGRVRIAAIVVAQAGKQMCGCDSVCDAVMDLHQQRPAVVRKAFDDPALPQRAVPVETPPHHVGGKAEQCVVISWIWD